MQALRQSSEMEWFVGVVVCMKIDAKYTDTEITVSNITEKEVD